MDVDSKVSLIQTFTECKLENFRYENMVGTAQFIDAQDCKWEVKVKTHNVLSTFINKGQKNTFMMSLANLNDYIPIKNGVYYPPQNFPEFMNHVRDGLSISYGYRKSKFCYLLSLTGDFSIHFLLQNLDSVTLTSLPAHISPRESDQFLFSSSDKNIDPASRKV